MFKTLRGANALRSIGLAAALLTVGFGLTQEATARPIKGLPIPSAGQIALKGAKLTANCAPASSREDLDINNVRATLQNGGDMWWDLVGAPLYNIPKAVNPGDPVKHAMFAASIWIGGLDVGGSLRTAAQTYRQTGNDFWPGPLSTVDASITDAECQEWDRHFKINNVDVLAHRAQYDPLNPTPDPNYLTPTSISNWPGNGEEPQATILAPFIDLDDDDLYEPGQGEYPDIRGDQAIWWVINDRGNIHTETGSEQIGMEIQSMAFAFQTADEINNMTFYQHTLINRSSNTLTDAYMGQWVDADLGFFQDDYVGCDVARGLGFCYNGDPIDDLPTGYGANPPAVGTDFFEGPLSDANDGVDNDKDGVIDELDTIYDPNDTTPPLTILAIETERIIQSKFVYYNNDFSTIGNPENITHFYNYLIGLWKDGTPITYGGNGYGGATTTNYMFSDGTDPDFQPPVNSPWNEQTAGNTPGDRRYIQSAGPFTLLPGAVNRITVGAVWGRSQTGDPLASVDVIKRADDKAQQLFESNFDIVDGPAQPSTQIVELDQQAVIYVTNRTDDKTLEGYEEADPLIIQPDTGALFDNTYNFEGFILYQLKDATVGFDELEDPSLARIVSQSDIRNGIGSLINYETDPILGPIPEIKVSGADQGLQRVFSLTRDLFAAGSDDRLVNYRKYYYRLVAYAYNNYAPYDPQQNSGQAAQFLSARRAEVITVIPHKRTAAFGGTILRSSVGSEPEITRVSGMGNGGRVLEFTDATINNLLQNAAPGRVTYESGFGPVSIRVYDPTRIPNAKFRLEVFNDSVRRLSPTSIRRPVISQSARWRLTNLTTGDTIGSESDLGLLEATEQPARVFKNGTLTDDYGFSINVTQSVEPGTPNRFSDATARLANNGFLSGSVSYGSPENPYVAFLPDQDESPLDWIYSGAQTTPGPPGSNPPTINLDASGPPVYADGRYGSDFLDPFESYETQISSGQWAPFLLTRTDPGYPGVVLDPSVRPNNENRFLQALPSVRVVITPDRSKWTRAVVLEQQNVPQIAQGNAARMDARNAPSVDKEGRADGNGTGLGWFPGYALNLETGERVNMMFGEDSGFPQENGADMQWNPTGNIFFGGGTTIPPNFSGSHFVYVTNTRYSEDSAATYRDLVTNTPLLQVFPRNQVRSYVLSKIQWTSIPLNRANSPSSFLNSDITVRLNVIDPLAPYNVATSTRPGGPIPGGDTTSLNPIYEFDMASLAATREDVATAKSALDLITVTPNPYYSYSGYERNQLDNIVYVTNLPVTSTATVYTTGGILVRRLERALPDDVGDNAYLSWDMKNAAGVPVASGMYLIHVNAPGVGERTLKFFAIIRPTDVDAF